MQAFFYRNHNWIAIFILTLFTGVIYQNSLSVPFYLDDLLSIENNELVKSGTIIELLKHYKLRFVAYFSFWLDYQISGSLTQFHISSILVHISTILTVFTLTYTLCQLTRTRKQQALFFSFITSLIFAIHPLQTQAVVYIVQRTAMLVALFYLIAVLSYIKCRTSEQLNGKILWIMLFGLSSCLAIFTKQNAFTIPFVLILAEILIIKKLSHDLLTKLFITCLVVICVLISLDYWLNTGVLTKLDAYTRENDIYSRWQYFTAQLSILWVYIGKFFWPWPLRLEYGYAIDHFSKAQTIISVIAHVALISTAIIYRKKLPLFAFGVLFFYITHGIESSIIPIKDIAFEHRMYLPMFGLILATVALLSQICNKVNKSYIYIAIIAVTLSYSILTYNRITLWQHPIAFYHHELGYQPSNCRVLNNLANEYYKANKMAKGHQLIERCMKVSGGELKNPEAVNNYLAMLINTGRFSEAEKLAEKQLKTKMMPIFRRRILENIGMMAMQQKNYPKAEKYLIQALELPNPLPKTYLALAVANAQQGRYKQAYKINKKLLSIAPNYQAAINLNKRLFRYIQ